MSITVTSSNLSEIAHKLTESGYIVIPARKRESGDMDVPKFGNLTESLPIDDRRWKRADRIAIVLRDIVLVDDDGYKVSSPERDAVLAELTDGLALVQWNEDHSSRHYVGKLDGGDFQHSHDNFRDLKIDIKRGNQLMYIKPGKELDLRTLCRRRRLCEANGAVKAALTERRKTRNVAVKGEVTEADMLRAERIVAELGAEHFADRDNWLRFISFANAALQVEEFRDRTMALIEAVDDGNGETMAKIDAGDVREDWSGFLGMACELPKRPAITVSASDLEDEEDGAAVAVITKPMLIMDMQGKVNDMRDLARADYAKARNLKLSEVPVDIKVSCDKHGAITGIKRYGTADNLKWILQRAGLTPAYNIMNDRIELCDAKGRSVFNSQDELASAIKSALLTSEIDKSAFDDHFVAIGRQNNFHPVAAWLDNGRGWDGVERFPALMDCLDVADKELATALIRGMLIASVIATDATNNGVAIKYVPTLFSKANDWFKTSFFGRLYDVKEGWFNGGATLNPEDKDSVKQNTAVWFSELGEVDQMNKRESGALKAFIGKTKDIYRAAYAKHESERVRRSVFGATVNKDDFIQDATTATRFPVIELKSAINIEGVNKLLGWEFKAGKASLVNPELLRQFWLEVRSWVDAGEGYDLSPAIMAKVRATGARFVAKDPIAQTLEDFIAGGGSFHDLTATAVIAELHLNGAQYTPVRVGKVLAAHPLICRKMRGGVAFYSTIGNVEDLE